MKDTLDTVDIDKLSNNQIYDLTKQYVENVKKGGERFHDEGYLPLKGPFEERNQYMYCMLNKLATINKKDEVKRLPRLITEYKKILKAIKSGSMLLSLDKKYDDLQNRLQSMSESKAKLEYNSAKKQKQCFNWKHIMMDETQLLEPNKSNITRLALTETANDVSKELSVASVQAIPSAEINLNAYI